MIYSIISYTISLIIQILYTIYILEKFGANLKIFFVFYDGLGGKERLLF